MLRVMVIDSNEQVQKALTDILESKAGLEVVCRLNSCEGAIEMVEWISPDVVLAGHISLEKDKSGFFNVLLKKRIPLIVTTAKAVNQLNQAFTYLEKGAVDFLILPSSIGECIKKVKAAAIARPINLSERLKPLKLNFKSGGGLRKVVVIASSTGGPQALRAVIPNLPKSLPAAFIVVQHMGEGFTALLAKRLDKTSALTVKEAVDGDILKEGWVYVAPSGRHLAVENSKIVLVEGPPINGVIPSADYTMAAVAREYGDEAVAVVLTGMGRDGAKGSVDIKSAGGRVIVQDKDSSVIFGMPQAALKTGQVDKVVELSSVASTLAKEVYA